jgi:putative glycosyltransferase (TIGR04348 family)
MDAVIVTPAPPGSRHGNRNTALRWARHLRSLGHRATIETQWHGRSKALMIALHARRSHASMTAWRNAYADRPLVCVLTGTDLYRDIRSDEEAKRSLDLADRLVVLQEKGLDELEPRHRAKAVVIFQSVPAFRREAPPVEHCLLTVIGHLRDEKDPFCTARALAYVRRDVQVVHLGAAMSDDMAHEAERLMSLDRRYRWMREVTRLKAMRWLARSHAMVISSRMEGGAHVVSEAIAAGVPVIASDISGNVGLLGADYPAYYPVGDEQALARLIERVASDSAFVQSLTRHIEARRSLVDPATERQSLAALVEQLTR